MVTYAERAQEIPRSQNWQPRINLKYSLLNFEFLGQVYLKTASLSVAFADVDVYRCNKPCLTSFTTVKLIGSLKLLDEKP